MIKKLDPEMVKVVSVYYYDGDPYALPGYYATIENGYTDQNYQVYVGSRPEDIEASVIKLDEDDYNEFKASLEADPDPEAVKKLKELMKHKAPWEEEDDEQTK